MERHTKHRILGVLVVIGLVVIMLPFFQTKNELPSETALVKTPPFPDQAASATSSSTELALPNAEPETPATPATNESAAAGSETSAMTNDPIESADASDSADSDDAPSTPSAIPLTVNTAPMVTPIPDSQINPKTEDQPAVKQADATVKNDVAVDEAAAKPAEVVSSNEATILPAGSERDMADIYDKPSAASAQIKVAKAVATATKVASKQKAKSHAKARTVKHVDGYQVLDPSEVASATKSTVTKTRGGNWAVQLGSFKNKSNAVRLVNLLRSKGYHSFMEQASSSKQGLTKVLVGPEFKKDGAHTLASKLETDVHLRGIVINYKPLAL